MSNPNPNLKNLKSWKPGQSGNPKGKPKGIPNSKTRLLRLLELTEQLKNPISGELEGFSVAEQMDLAVILKAKKGDIKAYNAILDRLEGKPTQAIEHSGGKNPIRQILEKYGGGEGQELEFPEDKGGSPEDSS